MMRGLVLEGGGAKGAYALGCLLAFRNQGITFDVISGTSVGALNAALASADSLECGKLFWQTLSFNKVCKPSRRISMWALFPFHIVAMFLHHIPFFGSIPFSSRQAPKDGYIYIAIVSGVPLLLFWLFICAFYWLVNDKTDFIARNIHLTAFMLILSILWAIPYWLKSKNQSLFTVDPLRRAMDEILHDATLNTKIYATLAEEQKMFDPDNPGFHYMGHLFGVCQRAIGQLEYVPHYIRLDKLPIDRMTDILTASAAIPFCVFPAVMLNGKEYIDGGFADNIPLFPVLEYHKCDEVYVVRLRPNCAGEIAKVWQRVDRRLRVARMDQNTCKSLYYKAMKVRKARSHGDETIYPPENVPYRRFPFDTSQIVVISPKRSLGSFLGGTMNFNAIYAKRLDTG